MNEKSVCFVVFLAIILLPLAAAVTGEAITGEVPQAPTNVSVFVEPGAPIIYIHSPENKTYYDTSILLNYSIRNPLDNVWYNLDNSNNISLGNLTDNSLTFTTTLGTHTFYLFANSSLGNSSDSVFFIVAQQSSSSSSSSSGSSSGGGSSSSGGGAIIYNFNIDKELIKISLSKGQTKTEKIIITNTGTVKLNIKLISGLANLIEIPEQILDLEPGKEKQVEIQFLSDAEPGIYPGKIYFTSGVISKSIDFVLGIKEPGSIFDLSLVIPEKYKKTNPGKKISVSIDITKIGAEETTNAYLSLYLTDFQRNLISEKITESLSIDKELSITRELKIPSNLKEGTYVVITELSYNGFTASSYDTFDVVKKQGLPFPWWLLVILAIVIALIIILTINLLAFKKQYEEKS